MTPSIESVLVIGSGPIVIGQAAEFDYSGTQACRVLREEGIRVVLLNSNPATIMTDPGFADATYIEPITAQVVEQIIAKEHPDALLATLGGQTALNMAIELAESGVLERYGVRLIGANIDAIRAGEDREVFKQIVEQCGAQVARSQIANSMDQALEIAEQLGYPLVVRPSFTMGGLGSGVARDRAELLRIAGMGLKYSPTHQVLLEESILGWKEFELELMRDRADNVVVVCSIENLDPVGVHTGDSITVAPALTLTDREYQRLRDIAIAVIRRVGVDTGGCNIQFAVEPGTGRVIVVEMNPRVSRSSALASKATGYPIAKIAARLAIGYTLDQITNEITGKTTAAFEPTLDYIAVKVPRFTFEKYPTADPELTTTMKSVGEAMALGRNFTEALGKALRSVEKGDVGFHWRGPAPSPTQVCELVQSASTPTENRLQQVQQAIRGGATVAELHRATGIDPWFLDQLVGLQQVAACLADAPTLNADILRLAKRHGLSDGQIGEIRNVSAEAVREIRLSYGVRPVFKAVDTCAAEFPSLTPYYYSTYDQETEVEPRNRPAVLVLGSGPNRIGQGIEFDYSCVHASLALREHFETVMVNCNPETVSTDYDTADRLYFEPITFEDAMEVFDAESSAGPVAGVIVQMGGQTPLALSTRLQEAGVPILGTPPSAIDAAEDRSIFGELLLAAGLAAPPFGTARTPGQALNVAEEVGYPVLARPSYVLGGRGMRIVYSRTQLLDYLRETSGETKAFDAPVLIDRFLDEAVEIDVDALYDGHDLFLGAVMEHIEEAGIHSGDSACILPPATLSRRTIGEVREATLAIARGIGVKGLLNIQFALSSGVLFVLEANPRASRTVPFASKATGVSLAKAAALISVGETVASLRDKGILPAKDAARDRPRRPFAVKEAVLPFKRFRTSDGRAVDTILGPEMCSTGESMGLDPSLAMAFAKSQAGSYGSLPQAGKVFVSVADRHKRDVVFPAMQLAGLGFSIIATEGTAEVLSSYGLEVEAVQRQAQQEGGVPVLAKVIELIELGDVVMVVNTPTGREDSRSDGYAIRSAATSQDIPIVTTIQQLGLVALAIRATREKELTVQSLQSYGLMRPE